MNSNVLILVTLLFVKLSLQLAIENGVESFLTKKRKYENWKTEESCHHCCSNINNKQRKGKKWFWFPQAFLPQHIYACGFSASRVMAPFRFLLWVPKTYVLSLASFAIDFVTFSKKSEGVFWKNKFWFWRNNFNIYIIFRIFHVSNFAKIQKSEYSAFRRALVYSIASYLHTCRF